MKNLVEAESEAEYRELYENSKIGGPLRTPIEEANFPQGNKIHCR